MLIEKVGELHAHDVSHFGELRQPHNGARALVSAYGTLPMMGNALKSLRTMRKLTQDDTAAAMGMSKSGYIKLERGERRLKVEQIQRAAEVFNVDAAAILGGDTEEDISTVPVVGFVSAGQAHFFGTTDGDLDRVDAPDNSTSETVAVEIRGSSLGALFDRWLIFYDEVRSPITSDLIGRLCVVGLPDDRVLVKRVRRAKTPNLYHLESNTEETIFDVEILWAARVRNMAPR